MPGWRVLLAVHNEQQELIGGHLTGQQLLLVAGGNKDGSLEQALGILCKQQVRKNVSASLMQRA